MNKIIPTGKLSKINHIAFNQYKNIFIDKEAVICGTGFSLNNYIPIKDAIHMGCNRCVFYDKLIFDFYFFNDWSKVPAGVYRDKILSYKPNIAKFFGTFPAQRSFGCVMAHAQQANAYLYDMEGPGGGSFQVEIDKYYVGDKGCSTVFVQMQFALFCGFKTIYIAGCDIDNLKNTDHNQRYFFNDRKIINNPGWYAPLKDRWKIMKNFINDYYPNTKIISINPMGLKGLFEDIYQ